MISIFAGRIANTGCNPIIPFIFINKYKPSNIKTLWASSRQVYDIMNAEDCGADIITLPYDLIDKLYLFGKDLSEYSIETTKMFHTDGKVYQL